MRKNKKLLLASVAAMGALALGVGATSTFAWFQATSGAAVAKNGADETVTVNKSDVSVASVDLPVNIEIAPVDNTPAPLELAHYYAADAVPTVAGDVVEVNGEGAALYTAYYDANSKLHYNKGATKNTNALYRIYKIEITAPADTLGGDTYAYVDPSGQTWTQAQIRTALASRTATATVANNKGFTSNGDAALDNEKTYYTRSGSAGSYVYTVVDNPQAASRTSYYLYGNVSASRARFMESTSSTATIANGTNTIDVEIALTNINVSGESYKAVGYFALYVEGSGDDTAQSSISAAFSCILADTTV